jgi:flagellar biosynthesis protein FlhB
MSGEGDSGGGGEKTFDPTPQRLAEARRKGDIPRSNDVSAAAIYLGFLAVVLTVGAFAMDRAASVLMIFIAQPDRLMGHVLGPGGPGLTLAVLSDALRALAPFFVVPIVAVVASLAGQQAITFSGEKLAPRLSRISVLKNAGQKFGPTGLVEFAKSLVKLGAIAAALFVYLSGDLDRMIGATRSDPRVTGALMMQSLVVLLGVTAIIAVAIAGVDLVWQRFDHARRLRMSYQDLKDEAKQAEGDPYMKAQRRSRAQAIATNRMLLDVPKADVVIVNPTHYAVALQWSRAKGSAPVCVAKGEDEIALRIREIAATANIPVRSDPPAARALHASVEIGREIAPEHYRAVAAAIRFSDRLRAAARARGRP